MTEAETLYQISVHQEIELVILQWWVSVSIGLLALAHFLSKKLNLYVLLLLIGTYVAYSLYMFTHLKWTFEQQTRLMTHLATLEQQGVLNSASEYIVENLNNPLAMWSFSLSVFALFLGTIVYVIYSASVRKRPAD
jgi:hypothetical protein